MTDYVVFVAYSQVHLAPAGVSPIFDPSEVAGLTSVTDAGRGLIIHTGINMGWVRVRLLVGEDEPAREGWEEESVVQMNAAEMLYLTSPTVEEDNFHPVHEPARPGSHTVTVLARGRSVNPGGIAEEGSPPSEEYLLAIAP